MRSAVVALALVACRKTQATTTALGAFRRDESR
jgi:hypothetical protein